MRITVFGRPVTQGSMIRTKWAMRSSNSDTLKPWRDNVRSAALDALDEGGGFGTKPVLLFVAFTFDRPASHYGTGRNSKTVKSSAPMFPTSHNAGDIDKLARACLDALTDAGTWKDDSQVIGLHASKFWVGTMGAGLDRPGAVIVVHAAADGEPPEHLHATHSHEGIPQ